jgi:ketosteroid isomerase-like protein
MSDHPNATRVHQMFEAFLRGDVDRIRATLAEHVVWHFPGRRGKLAGRHEGRDAVFAFLLDVARLTDETFRLELTDVLANDRHAVALFRGTGSRNGMTLDNPTCLQMRIEDGQVVELREFVWDLYHVEEFWS